MTYEKLPPAFKKKWVEKLRSGEWKQCKERLRSSTKDDDGDYHYCVLGTAAHLVGAKKIEGGELAIGQISKRAWSKIPCTLKHNSDDLASNNGAAEELMMMNDKGASFQELADWIDKNL